MMTINEKWNELETQCKSCKLCELAAQRKNVVIGRGNKNAKLLFVGEGPGSQEDEQGLPFVGQAGQLLNLAITSCGLTEDSYYITNVVKCRPPQNRTPLPIECEACLPYLRTQFALIRPTIIVCLGAIATNALIDKNAKISQIRGNWIEKKGIYFMPTFHPAALLRDESKKMDMWEDIKKAKDKLEEINNA